ncbi:MAG: hypothetical protein AAF570_13225, partial [Bacteroidota bacterium]
DYPRYNVPKLPPGKKIPIPPGPRVAPGTYQLQVKFRDHRDSSTFKVLPDPRTPYNAEAIAAREAMISEFMRYGKAATEGFSRLRDVRNMVGDAEKALKNADKAVRDSLMKESKVIRDSIKTLMHVYLAPENSTGIDAVTRRLSDAYWRTGSYLRRSSRPGGNAELAMSQFKGKVEAVLQRINRFLNEDWKAFREKVEAAQKPLFKEVEDVKLDE